MEIVKKKYAANLQQREKLRTQITIDDDFNAPDVKKEDVERTLSMTAMYDRAGSSP